MNWLALLKKVPPEILKEIEGLGDLEQYLPYVKKFVEFKRLAADTTVGTLVPADLTKMFGIADIRLSDWQAETLVETLRRFSPDPDVNVMSFLRDGGIKHIMTGIATPQQNLDTDNAIRCPHCHGLIVRIETHPGFDDVIVCQHCGKLIINA